MRLTIFFLATILFCFAENMCYSATYYVKASGGSGSGLSDADAWSAAKFAQAQLSSLRNGDIILFKRGDSFHIKIQIERGNLTYGAYGSGDNPVISGFSTIKHWVKLTEHVYYAQLDVPDLNSVTLDGMITGKGRYPNSGYLNYSGHSGNSSVSGSSIGGLPFDPVGGEIVIRKERWILDRHKVDRKTNNAIQYSDNGLYGQNNNYQPIDGNGYFIQNCVGVLDVNGEWSYDHTQKRIYMFFASGNPSQHIVNVSTIDKNVQLNYWQNTAFSDLVFEGANDFGIWLIGTKNISFNDCTWRNQGGDAVWGSGIENLNISGGNISNSLNCAIRIESEGRNVKLDGISIQNSGTIPGLGKSGDGSYSGVIVNGQDVEITNCSIINSGFNGIDINGSADNVLIRYNFIDSFCKIKDDGAGIYTFNSSGVNRKISQNIILNAEGAFAGAESSYWESYGKAAGIYVDGGKGSNLEIAENVIANGPWGGIFINGARDISIVSNLVFNYGRAFLLANYANQLLRNLTVNNNIFVVKNEKQFALYIFENVQDSIKLYGVFDNNVYSRPLDERNSMLINSKYAEGASVKTFALTDWKKQFNQDASSLHSAVSVVDQDSFRFEYNKSKEKKSVTLQTMYADVSGHLIGDSMPLMPFTGTILLKYNNTNTSLTSGSWTDPKIWSLGTIPNVMDMVIVDSGHIIRVSTDISAKSIYVRSKGQLVFTGEFKIKND